MSQDKKPVGIECLALLPGRGFRKQSQTNTKKKKEKKMCACKNPSFVFVDFRCIFFHALILSSLHMWHLNLWIGLLRNQLRTYQRLIDRIEASHGARNFRQQIELKKIYTNSPFGSCHSFPPVKTFCGAPSVQLITRSAWLLSKSDPADTRTEKREKSDHTEFKRYYSLLITSKPPLIIKHLIRDLQS